MEPFKGPWWYRQEFDLPKEAPFATARLIFEGINYRANIFLNGEKIAAADQIFGAFRVFDLNISDLAVTGRNYLAVEVLPPQPGEPTIGFVDWNPKPPDRNMGIFRPVRVKLSGPVSLDHPFVTSQVDTQTLKEAKLTVTALLTNHGDKRGHGHGPGGDRRDHVQPALHAETRRQRRGHLHPRAVPATGRCRPQALVAGRHGGS